MRVLVACEFSGTVRDAFIARGHDAVSCDLLPTEKPGPHIRGDVREVLENGWDMMIAHPPCTYLSRAGARWLYPVKGEMCAARKEKLDEARDFFLALWSAPIPYICLENPTPLRESNLPRPSHVVQPFEFGHAFTKRTLFWLKNLPPLMPTAIVGGAVPFLPSNTGAGKRKGQRNSRGVARDWKDASRTFPGIAAAMADQWGQPDLLTLMEAAE